MTIRYRLFQVLNQLCDIIVEPLRDHIVTGLLQASMVCLLSPISDFQLKYFQFMQVYISFFYQEGLLRVLLDGGSSRLFLPGDAKFIEEDLEVLKEFFISGGDGLPRGTVENQVSHLRHVIKLLGCETRVLIDDLKSASSSEVQGNRSKLGADSQTLLRILCHRCDSEASQFLKKQYKIPKSAA
ncbi:hypothetical protein IFM89_036051 [Coptis chinensis]|uniref:MHD2 domain-containing protein n=1 Tax=Coptis chinensis TaxID=261450 RepID=A0A835HDT0_9MAGN|nr:hypothetical protein IFM89_036051 [Coptis chinensis]